MNNSLSEALQPCPFCGGKKRWNRRATIANEAPALTDEQIMQIAEESHIQIDGNFYWVRSARKEHRDRIIKFSRALLTTLHPKDSEGEMDGGVCE